jgi:hypothetical protein
MVFHVLNIFLQIEQKLAPIELAWPGCRKVTNELIEDNMSGYLSVADNLTNIVIVSGIIVFFIIAFSRIITGTKEIFMAAFTNKKLLKIEKEINMRTNRNTLLLFSIILLSFVVANHSETLNYLSRLPGIWMKFLIILAIVPAYLILKYLFFCTMTWINGKLVFKVLLGINSTFLTFILVGDIFGCIVYAVIPSIELNYLLIYILCCTAIGTVVFFIRGYQLIISNGFSHFFWILYLCTLELLPIAIVATIFL